VKFDGAHAKACLDKIALNPSTCFGPAASSRTIRGQALNGPSVDRVPLDCTLIFTGTVADGGSCYGRVDCISGSCDQSNSACPGKCRPTAHEGGPCSEGGACPRGLVCVWSSGGDFCQQPGAAGARCDENYSCKDNLICLNHACAARLAQGGACSNPGECADGLYCGSGGTCQARVDAGGACTSSSTGWWVSEQCKGNQLCLGATHSAPGRCATPQDAGGPCSRAAGATGLAAGCFDGLVCDAATSKCVLAPKVGQPCPDHVCDLTSAYCSGNGTCLAKVADGQACTTGEQCSPASQCDSSSRTCVPSIQHGASCREP
jgi:hypothetical protein